MFEALDCLLMIDWRKFKAFTESWLKRFHESKFSWNWLNPTLHFLLHHGWEVIRDCPVPVGLLSEEGAECSNKHFRKHREHNARQSSLEKNLYDVMVRSHHISDIDIQRILVKTHLKGHKKCISARAMALLVDPKGENILQPPEPSEKMDLDLEKSEE